MFFFLSFQIQLCQTDSQRLVTNSKIVTTYCTQLNKCKKIATTIFSLFVYQSS